MTDDRPSTTIEILHSFWLYVAPDRSGRAESGAYIVQPARGAPSGTKKPASMIRPASNASQKDHMLMRGNAMSCVPIFSGIRKFAYPPTSRKNRLTNRNWMPMILWSVEKMYFCQNLMGAWCPPPCAPGFACATLVIRFLQQLVGRSTP